VYDLSAFVKKVQTLEKITETTRLTYIEYVRDNLSEEDYIDFLEAVLNVGKSYEEADEDIQILVDCYYGQQRAS